MAQRDELGELERRVTDLETRVMDMVKRMVAVEQQSDEQDEVIGDTEGRVKTLETQHPSSDRTDGE